MFCPITPFQVVRCEKYIHEQGSIFPDNCFEYHHLCYLQNWTLGPKLSSQWSDVKTSFTNRDCFYETIILSTNNPMLSSKLNVLSHNSIPSCQIWKIPSQAGVVGLQKLFWVSTILCYLQNWTFLFISIVFALSLHKPHFFYFSNAILIALNENLELTLLCRLRDFFKD